MGHPHGGLVTLMCEISNSTNPHDTTLSEISHITKHTTNSGNGFGFLNLVPVCSERCFIATQCQELVGHFESLGTNGH